MGKRCDAWTFTSDQGCVFKQATGWERKPVPFKAAVYERTWSGVVLNATAVPPPKQQGEP